MHALTIMCLLVEVYLNTKTVCSESNYAKALEDELTITIEIKD